MFCKQIVVALVGLVLLQLAPFRSGAQPKPALSADSVLRNTVSRIAAENRHSVRVASRETGRVEGERVSLLGDSAYLTDESGVRSIALVDVDSVWIQRGTAAAVFGLILGVPCAVFGGLIGSFIGGDPDSNGSPGRAAAGIIIGMLGGGFICGSAGAGFGSLIRRWQLEYARPALHGDYHQLGDEANYIDYPRLRSIRSFVAALPLDLADRPNRLIFTFPTTFTVR